MERTTDTPDPIAAAISDAEGHVDTGHACEVCTYADAHSWFGPGRTHHKRCHRTWESKIEGHCTMCCEHFANVKSFDAHLTAEGCRHPSDVIRKDGRPRLTTRVTAAGTTWRLAFYGTRPDFGASPSSAK